MTKEEAEVKPMQERLSRMGVAVKVSSTAPTSYELIYGTIRASGPTMDMAVADFIEKLLKRFGSQALPR